MRLGKGRQVFGVFCTPPLKVDGSILKTIPSYLRTSGRGLLIFPLAEKRAGFRRPFVG
jgi:hypothetical protein